MAKALLYDVLDCPVCSFVGQSAVGVLVMETIPLHCSCLHRGFAFFRHRMEQPSSSTSGACCRCEAAVRELQQEVRALRAELACHISCEHCGMLYDKRHVGACAATGTTHNDTDFQRCEVCRLVVPKATRGFRMGDFLDGVECVHRFHSKAAVVGEQDGLLRWSCCGARGAGATGCAILRFKVHHDVEGLAATLRKLH
jgi:hypothetical protein